MTPADSSDLRLLTMAEVAELLRIGRQQVLALCHSGDLSYIAVGKGRKRVRRMFERDDLERFIARRKRTDTWRKAQKISTAVRARRSGNTDSRSAVVDFVELLKQRRSARPANSSPTSGKPSPKK